VAHFSSIAPLATVPHLVCHSSSNRTRSSSPDLLLGGLQAPFRCSPRWATSFRFLLRLGGLQASVSCFASVGCRLPFAGSHIFLEICAGRVLVDPSLLAPRLSYSWTPCVLSRDFLLLQPSLVKKGLGSRAFVCLQAFVGRVPAIITCLLSLIWARASGGGHGEHARLARESSGPITPEAARLRRRGDPSDPSVPH
jgi:hypothetical protein